MDTPRRGTVRQNPVFSSAAIVVLLLSSGCTPEEHSHSPAGPYLGQSPPGTTPEIFAPGIVSTGMNEVEAAFSPDGTELYLAIMSDIGTDFVAAIAMARLEDGGWTDLEIAPFSDVGLNMDPFVHPDGSKLYFTSTRPLDGEPVTTEDDEAPKSNFWVVEREADSWSAPRPIGPPINGFGNVSAATVTRTGTMYFTRRLEDGWEGIFRSRLVDGQYQEPERLSDKVNTTNTQFHSSIAPDESYLILSIYGRDDSYGSTDYYVSFRDSNDVWSDVINLGDEINTEETEAAPCLSPDGRFFFFGSQAKIERTAAPGMTFNDLRNELHQPGNGSWDIHWVDVSVIQTLRPSS
jgi:hypothetical protein